MLTDVLLDAPMSMDQDVAMGLSPFYEATDAQMADHELHDDEMADSYGATYDDVMTDDGVAYVEHPAVTHDVEIVDLADEVPAAHFDSAVPVPHVGVEAAFIDHIPQHSEPAVLQNDHDLNTAAQGVEPAPLSIEAAPESTVEHIDPATALSSSDYAAAYAQEGPTVQALELSPETVTHDPTATAHEASPPTGGELPTPGAEYVEPVYDPQPETGDAYHLQLAQPEEPEVVAAEATRATKTQSGPEHDVQPEQRDYASHEAGNAASDAPNDTEPVGYPANAAVSDPVEYAEAPEFSDAYLPSISLSVFQMEHIRPPPTPERTQNDDLKRRPIGEQVVESTERKYDLFEPANETSGATLIFDNQTALYSQRLSVLFEALRIVLHTVDGQQLTNFNDLTLYSPGLDLLIPEDNVLSHELTLEDLINMLQRWSFTQFDLQLRIGAGHRAYDRYKWLQQQLEPAAATTQDAGLTAELATVDQPEQAVGEHAVAEEHLEEGQDWAEDAEFGQAEDDDHSSPAAEGEDDGGLEHGSTGDLVIGGDDGHAVADDSAWVEDGTEVVQTNIAAPVDGIQPEEFESHDEPAEGAEVEASVDEDGTEQYEDEEWAAGGEAEGVYADGEAEVVYANGETAELQVLGEVELEGDDESAEYDVGEYAEGQHDLESVADDSELAPAESEFPGEEAAGVDPTTTALNGNEDNMSEIPETAHAELSATQDEQHEHADGDAAADSAAIAFTILDDQEAADTNDESHPDDTTDAHSQQAEQEEEEWYEEGDVADVGDGEPYIEDDQATLSSAEDTSQPAPLATKLRPNLSPAGSKRSHDDLLRDNPDQDAGLEDDADHDYKRVRIE